MIELIVVILVLGLLAAIGVFAYDSVTTKARVAAAQTELTTVVRGALADALVDTDGDGQRLFTAASVGAALVEVVGADEITTARPVKGPTEPLTRNGDYGIALADSAGNLVSDNGAKVAVATHVDGQVVIAKASIDGGIASAGATDATDAGTALGAEPDEHDPEPGTPEPLPGYVLHDGEEFCAVVTLKYYASATRTATLSVTLPDSLTVLPWDDDARAQLLLDSSSYPGGYWSSLNTERTAGTTTYSLSQGWGGAARVYLRLRPNGSADFDRINQVMGVTATVSVKDPWIELLVSYSKAAFCGSPFASTSVRVNSGDAIVTLESPAVSIPRVG